MSSGAKKTVVFYLSDLQNGGSEWFAIRLARSLRKRGYAPSFLVAQKQGELLPMLRSEFPVTLLGASHYRLFSLLTTLPATLRFIATTRPDALISGLPLLNIMAALIKSFSRVSFRLLVVEHMRLYPAMHDICPLKKAVKKALTRFYHAIANDIVCVSQTVYDDLVSLEPTIKRRAHLIYNPIVPEDIDRLLENEDAVFPWLREKTSLVFLAIGRLLPVKDHTTLLQAFAIVRKKIGARLVILGEGTGRKDIEKKIDTLGLTESVAMPGSVENVFPSLKAADLFILASKNEAFGNVVVEALACGTPVVCTDCGGPREILEGGRYGTLVPVGDPQKLAEAIIAACAASCDTQDLAQRGRFFSTERAGESYDRLLRTII